VVKFPRGGLQIRPFSFVVTAGVVRINGVTGRILKSIFILILIFIQEFRTRRGKGRGIEVKVRSRSHEIG